MARLSPLLFLIAALGCARSSASTFALDYRARVAAPSSLALSSAPCVQQERPDAGVLRQVEISTACAPRPPEGLAVGDTLDVTLFDDCRVALALRERVSSYDGATSFLATADGYDGRLVAVVVCKDGRVNVDIQDFLSGRVYSVLSSPERTVVREVDSRQLPCACAEPPEAPRSASPSGAKAAARAKAATAVGLPKGASSPTTVDILVVYDTLAAEWAKSRGGGVSAFAEVQVQKMNAVLANTNLDRDFRFRLVGVYEVGGSAGGSLGRALEAAQSGDIVLNGVRWIGVHAKRDEVAADIVCVLVDNGLSYGTTGLGYSLYRDSGDFSEFAYNACLIRAVATGQTMTHEVGHNMGAGHATAVANVDDRGPQYYDYSAGYYFTGADGGGYYTIMAYSSDGYGNYYSPAPFFSSPDYTYKSVPVGDEFHDNSLTLRQTFPEVALYRETVRCRVTFGKNSGTGGDNYVTATYGKPMPTPRTAPKRTGWTFGGYWDTVAMDEKGNPKGRQYYDANMQSVRAWDKKGDATLWAKWTVKVTLGKNGGTGGDNYVTATYNQPFPKRTMPKKPGYAFGGYWMSSNNRIGQCYDADGTGTSTRGWMTGGTPAIWALWTK